MGAILSAVNPALATQTLTNITMGTGSVWSGTAIGIASGGTGAITAQLALQALGSMMNKVVAKSGIYTVLATDNGVVFNTTNTFALTLTAAATLGNGFTFGVVNSGVGTITVTPNGAEKVNGSSTMTIPTLTAALFICDGATWWTVSFWPGYGTSTQALISNGAGAAPSFGTATPILRSYLAGLTLSNDGGTPNTVLDIAAGVCTDSTNAVNITLGAFTKATGGAWAAGTGQNGMGAGLTIAQNTWYHVFAIINAAAADVYFDTSVSAANKPASTTSFRRIGSFKTATASTNILAFQQFGDLFHWPTPVTDINVTNPGTNAVTRVLTVPTGLNVLADITVTCTRVASAAYNVLISSLDETDAAPSGSNQTLQAGDAQAVTGVANLLQKTDTAASIRSRQGLSGAGDTLIINTKGWVDRRGRDV